MRYRRGTLGRILLVLSVFMLLFTVAGYARSAQTGPVKTVENFNTTLLKAMKGAKELGYSGRYKILEPVVKKSFALPFMLVLATGEHWKTLTKDQRKELLKVYTEWTVATYAGRFNGYSGERFEVVPPRGTPEGTVTVVSKLIKANNEEVDFHYLLRKMAGLWKIVDIHISGVSQLALTRAQFSSLLARKGYSSLIATLKEKIKTFSERKDR